MSLQHAFNPTAQDAYWQEAFRQEPYFNPGLDYDDYSPAYRVGYTGPVRRNGSFDALEADLQQDWNKVKGRSRLQWNDARKAVRAAWERVAEPAAHN